MPTRERVQEFIATVESGDHVGAIERFYTEDASMQENSATPRMGRALLVEFEKSALARLKEMKTRKVKTWLVDGDHVVINWVFEMTDHNSHTRILDELALQEWNGDRIQHERFYYDSARLKQHAA